MPLVVVEIGDHAAPAALSAVMVQACSSSFAQGSCALSDSGGEAPVAVATVKWGDAGERSVEIEVGTKRRGEAQWLSKTLYFRAVDPRAERWRSVGLTIATLARELATSPESAKETASEPPPTTGGPARSDAPPSPSRGDSVAVAVEKKGGSGPAEPAATPGRPSHDDPAADTSANVTRSTPWRSPRTALWLDAGPRGGRAFEQGSLRAGGFVAVAFHPLRSPLFARVAFGHEGVVAAPADLAAIFTSLTLGGGAALRLRETAFVVEPRAALVVERLGVSLTDDVGRTDDGSLWAAGALAGAAVVWELGWLSPLVGADASWRGQPADIVRTNQVIATVPSVDFSVHAALRMFL